MGLYLINSCWFFSLWNKRKIKEGLSLLENLLDSYNYFKKSIKCQKILVNWLLTTIRS